jgi:RNA polymerase sigma-70 factor (ECF subfamily)
MTGATPAQEIDTESADWVSRLGTPGPDHESAVGDLHTLLLRIARREVYRRAAGLAFSGRELDDLAMQAADDATFAVVAKVDLFRGESRFTTWAYRFVVLEVSHKVGRHFWRHPRAELTEDDWNHLPDLVAAPPHVVSEVRELNRAVRRAVQDDLTDHQRRIFEDAILRGIPLDALAVRYDTTRNALYKTLFDARRRIRTRLVADEYLPDEQRREARPVSDWSQLDAFLRTDPADVGCDEALRILHVYVELVASGEDAGPRYPGVASHLHQCGPCGEDFEGLLALVTDPPTSGARTRLRKILRGRR